MGAGSIAQVTGSGQGLPGTSWALNDFGSITTDVDSILSESAGVFTPQGQGYYLIIAESKFDSSHNNRLDIEQKIQKNSTDYAGAVGSDYSRNNGNDKSWMRSSMIAYFNGTTDDFEIQDRRDSGGGTPAGVYTWTRIKVIQLSAGDSDSLAYAHYGTPTSAAHAAAGAPDASSVVDGWDVITENDTASIELQAGGTDITLKKTDRPYLVLYGFPTDANGVGRTFRMSDLTFGGTRINHSFGHAYQRDASNQYAVPEGMALVAPSSEDDLNARIWLYEDNKAVFWGTCNGEGWTLSSAAGRAGIMVVELPPDTDYAIFDDATANQTWNTSATLDLNFAATESDAGSNFTKDSATAVSVDAAANVMAYAAYFIERTASSGTRLSNAARWELNGTDLTTETEFGQYMRGEQGADDEKNTALGITHIFAASASDTLNLEKFDPGTDDGNNDVTSIGGSFFIDLDSLDAGFVAETKIHTYEGETDETDISTTTGDSDDFNSVYKGTNATLKYDTARAKRGSASGRMETGATLTTLNHTLALDANPDGELWTSVYMYMEDSTLGNSYLLALNDGSANIVFVIRMRADDSFDIIQAVPSWAVVASSSAGVIPQDEWVRWDLYAKKGTSSNAVVTARLFTGANLEKESSTANADVELTSSTRTADYDFDMGQLGIMTGVANSNPRWVDDWQISNDTWPSPTGTPGSALLKLEAETEQTSDLELRMLDLTRLQAETLQLPDVEIAAMALLRLLAETEQVSDLNLKLRALIRQEIETQELGDAEIDFVILGLVRLQNETSQVAELVTKIQALLRQEAETTQLSEADQKLIEAVANVIGFFMMMMED